MSTYGCHTLNLLCKWCSECLCDWLKYIQKDFFWQLLVKLKCFGVTMLQLNVTNFVNVCVPRLNCPHVFVSRHDVLNKIIFYRECNPTGTRRTYPVSVKNNKLELLLPYDAKSCCIDCAQPLQSNSKKLILNPTKGERFTRPIWMMNARTT